MPVEITITGYDDGSHLIRIDDPEAGQSEWTSPATVPLAQIEAVLSKAFGPGYQAGRTVEIEGTKH